MIKGKLTALERIKQAQQNKTNLNESEKGQQEEAKKGVRDSLVKTIISADKGLEITKDKKAQTILNELAKGQIDNIEQLGKIAEKLAPYISGDKEILFSQEGQERTDLKKRLILSNLKIHLLIKNN